MSDEDIDEKTHEIRGEGKKSEELKPCPFCGEVSSIAGENPIDRRIRHKPHCFLGNQERSNHGAGTTYFNLAIKGIIEAWNKRV